MRGSLRLALVFVLLTAGAAAAQTVSATTGAIDGKVLDPQNRVVVSGVTVSVRGTGMMGTRTTVTNSSGDFRFIALNPGVYEVVFERDGYTTVDRKNINIPAAFTATLSIPMVPTQVEQAVTVDAASPMVDATATQTRTSFGAQFQSDAPLGSKDPWSTLSQTASVKMSRIDVGGSASGTQVTYQGYGSSGQNRPYVDGMNTTESTGGFGYYPDMASFQETVINAIGNNAEMGPPGIMHVYVGKSGGNAYHGEGALNYTTEKIQSFNIDEAQIKAGVVGGGGLEPRDTNRLYSFRDDYIQTGGYIKKDKWWFHVAYRDVENQIRQSNFPVKPFLTRLKTWTNKSTFQLTPNNQFVGYYMWMSKRQPNRLDRYQLSATRSIHLRDDDSFDQQYHPFIFKGEYNSVLSDAMFFEIRTGGIGYNWDDYNYTTAPSYEDTSTGLVSGAARKQYSDPRRYQVLGSTSYYHPGWVGSHNMKLGWEIFRETGTNGQRAGSYNDVVHILRNGAPFEVYLLGNPTNATAGLWTIGLYLTDNWRPSERISMNLGVRYDRYQNFLSAQRHEADRFFPETVEFPEIKNVRLYTTVAPRFGLTYDISGDGKTVIKANTGLYWENPGTGAGNPNGAWYKRYSWSDTNGNSVWDNGEQGRLIAQLGGTKTVDNDPDHQDPRTVDVSVWLERELAAGFSARTGWVRRQELMLEGTFNTNQPYEAFTIPTTVRDPGPDGRLNTADDGGTIPAMNLQSQWVGLPNQSLVTNYESWCAKSGFSGCGSHLYNSFEGGISKRMSHRWSAAASVSYKRNQVSKKPDNPNSFINSDEDGRDTTSDYSFKLNGTLQGPMRIRFSPVYSYQAGTNFARTFVTATGQLNYGTTTLNSELLSERRNSTVSIMNLRIDRPIAMGGFRLSPQLDLYNLFNANPLQDVTVTSGSSFLRPINIVPPRVVRFGFKVEW